MASWTPSGELVLSLVKRSVLIRIREVTHPREILTRSTGSRGITCRLTSAAVAEAPAVWR